MVTKPRAYRDRAERAEKRPVPPLDARKINDLALHYVARFATSAAKLETYLKRKLRERGWAGEAECDVRAIAANFVEAGYIDDEAFARAKSGSLLRRGYGARRVTQALTADGIGEDTRAAVRAGAGVQRRAALALATKRRLGPFGPPPADRAAREKQVGAMLRAGHPLDFVRALLSAPSEDAAQAWAAEADEDDAPQ